jgi:hypothetical protein
VTVAHDCRAVPFLPRRDTHGSVLSTGQIAMNDISSRWLRHAASSSRRGVEALGPFSTCDCRDLMRPGGAGGSGRVWRRPSELAVRLGVHQGDRSAGRRRVALG